MEIPFYFGRHFVVVDNDDNKTILYACMCPKNCALEYVPKQNNEVLFQILFSYKKYY